MAHEFKFTRKVEFAETDLAGIVHFSNFFLYMEQAEHAFLRSLGFSVHNRTPDGIISFPRVRAECDYRQPLRFEDEVEVHLLVREKKPKSVEYEFNFRNLSQDPPVLVACGSITVVCAEVGAGPMRAVPIPKDMSDMLEVAP